MGIEADGFVLDDPSDLPKIGKVIKSFSLKGHGPTSGSLYVTFDAGPREVNAYCSDIHDPVGVGAVVQVEELVRHRRAALVGTPSSLLTALFWLLVVLSFFTVVAPRSLVPLPLEGAMVIAMFVVYPLKLWTQTRDGRAKGRVYTSRVGDRPGWLERNRDALAIAIVSAFLGAGLAAIAGLVIAFVTGAWKP